MTPQTVENSPAFGEQIRARRLELGMSIEQAAAAAKVGSETWRRYEAGSQIRSDKVRGLLHALRWTTPPSAGEPSPLALAQRDAWIAEHRGDMWEACGPETSPESYSAWLAEVVDEGCARVFAAGVDILDDEIQQDLRELASMRRGTHIGELEISWIDGLLPAYWAMRYDYEFLHRLRAVLTGLRLRAVHRDRSANDDSLQLTSSIADRLALRLLMERGLLAFELDERISESAVSSWENDLGGEDDDEDILWPLYGSYGDLDGALHIDRWFER